ELHEHQPERERRHGDQAAAPVARQVAEREPNLGPDCVDHSALIASTGRSAAARTAGQIDAVSETTNTAATTIATPCGRTTRCTPGSSGPPETETPSPPLPEKSMPWRTRYRSSAPPSSSPSVAAIPASITLSPRIIVTIAGGRSPIATSTPSSRVR